MYQSQRPQENHQNAIIRLSIRNSAMFSESVDLSNVQSYSEFIQVTPGFEEDFQQVRQSYRSSVSVIRLGQLQNKKEHLLKDNPNNEVEQVHMHEDITVSKSGSASIQQVFDQNRLLFNEKPITVLLVLVSNDEIQSLSTLYEKKKQIKIKFAKRKILDKYAAIALFTMHKSQIAGYAIKYTVRKSLFIFSKTEQRILDFGGIIFNEQVGILCNQLNQGSPQQLINCCIIEGHQYLVKHIQQLEKTDINILKLYYQIFRKHFKAYSKNISVVLQSVNIDKSSFIFSQFFLYFVFVIYRQGALELLKQNGVYNSLNFNRNSLPKILNKKRYNYFQNGHYLKQFIVYAIFLYGYNVFSQNLYTFLKIVKSAIVELSPLYVQAIFNKLKNNQIMNSLLSTPNIEAIFLYNKQITFLQYFQVMLKYCENLLPILREQGAQKMTDLILTFMIKLNSKGHVNRLCKQDEQALQNYEKRLCHLFKHKSQYNLQIKRLGQIYMQIKGLFRFSVKLGETILNILKSHIFNNCEVLLKYFFGSIICPLVIFPQLAQQTSVLIDYFMKKQVQTQNVITMINFLLKSQRKVFNHQTIQFVLKKYIKQNPFIGEFKVQQLKKFVEDRQKDLAFNSDCRSYLYHLVQLLQAKEVFMPDQKSFCICINEIKFYLEK